MDTRDGFFVADEKAETWMQRLEVGEIVKIKGEELEVVAIKDREVTLRLRSEEDRRRSYEEHREIEIARHLEKVLNRR